jgi:hypothetical protein
MHLKTKHQSVVDGDVFFKERLNLQRDTVLLLPLKLLVSYTTTAKAEIPHAVAEQFILPSAQDTVILLIRSTVLRYLNCSHCLVSKTQLHEGFMICRMILSQILVEIKTCPSALFNIVLDESIDVWRV